MERLLQLYLPFRNHHIKPLWQACAHWPCLQPLHRFLQEPARCFLTVNKYVHSLSSCLPGHCHFSCLPCFMPLVPSSSLAFPLLLTSPGLPSRHRCPPPSTLPFLLPLSSYLAGFVTPFEVGGLWHTKQCNNGTAPVNCHLIRPSCCALSPPPPPPPAHYLALSILQLQPCAQLAVLEGICHLVLTWWGVRGDLRDHTSHPTVNIRQGETTCNRDKQPGQSVECCYKVKRKTFSQGY